jgi:hypothetical protein
VLALAVSVRADVSIKVLRYFVFKLKSDSVNIR